MIYRLLRRLEYRSDDVRPENWKELVDLAEEYFHVFPVRLWQTRATDLAIRQDYPPGFRSVVDEATLQIADVSFGKILILADKDDDLNPEVTSLVLFQSVTDNLGFSNVGLGLAGFRINSSEQIPNNYGSKLSCNKSVTASITCLNFSAFKVPT